jgi:hypothetical protein
MYFVVVIQKHYQQNQLWKRSAEITNHLFNKNKKQMTLSFVTDEITGNAILLYQEEQ